MLQRIRSIVITGVILSIDFYICNSAVGTRAAAVFTGIILLYSFWLGEFIALRSAAAIPIKRIKDNWERKRLESGFEQLKEEVGSTIKYYTECKLYLIPDDSVNTYAFGTTIGITRGALNCLDESTMSAVLAHEISHVICMDSVINRLLFAHVLVIMSALILTHFAVIAAACLIVLALCLLGMRFNLFTFFLTRGVFSILRKVGSLIQHLVLSILKVIMSLISRGCEYRADLFSCKLGYGYQLVYFLERFTNINHKRTLAEVLYDSHPSSKRRIERIESYNNRKMQVPVRYLNDM